MPKQIKPLTETQIKQAKPKNALYKMYDGGGLYLYVTPAGNKIWRMKMRVNAVEKTLVIGDYPETCLASARQKRIEAQSKLASGKDPTAAKREAVRARVLATENTFKAVALE